MIRKALVSITWSHVAEASVSIIPPIMQLSKLYCTLSSLHCSQHYALLIKTDDSLETLANTSALSYTTILSQQIEQDQIFFAYAANASARSVLSSFLPLSLEVSGLPSPPRALKVLAVEQNSVSLTWQHPQGTNRIDVSMCLSYTLWCLMYSCIMYSCYGHSSFTWKQLHGHNAPCTLSYILLPANHH